MLQALIGPVTGLLDKFVEDKDQKARLAHDIATMAEKHAHEAAMAQVEVNKAEAGHRSIFVAGWRPFIGWTCGVALAYHFIFAPLIVFGATWMLYLNTVQEGGETEFLYKSLRVQPKAGRFVLWPSGYTHTHRGNPPLNQDKYILTGWAEQSELI